jgi:hypothetical protein
MQMPKWKPLTIGIELSSRVFFMKRTRSSRSQGPSAKLDNTRTLRDVSSVFPIRERYNSRVNGMKTDALDPVALRRKGFFNGMLAGITAPLFLFQMFEHKSVSNQSNSGVEKSFRAVGSALRGGTAQVNKSLNNERKPL